MNKHRQPL